MTTRSDLLAGLRMLDALRSQAIARGKRKALPGIGALEKAAIDALKAAPPEPIDPRLAELWARPAFAPTLYAPMDTAPGELPCR